jgi:hypothetical protein
MTVQHFTQRNLVQTITYWAPTNGTETNDFGQVETGNGVAITGRWENKVQQVRKSTGEEVTSMATVFVDREVAVGGFLREGDFDGDARTEEAMQIQAYATSPDLRNLGTERRAYL